MSGVWLNVLGRCDGQWQVSKVHGAVPWGCSSARLVSQRQPWLRWTPSAMAGAVTAAIPESAGRTGTGPPPALPARATLYCTLYTVHCTLYALHCSLLAVNHKLYTVHRTCSVPCHGIPLGSLPNFRSYNCGGTSLVK